MLCCMCDVGGRGGWPESLVGGWGVVKVCIFHNQKIHVYLIFVIAQGIQLNKKNIKKQFALNGVCCRNWDFRKISSN